MRKERGRNGEGKEGRVWERQGKGGGREGEEGKEEERGRARWFGW